MAIFCKTCVAACCDFCKYYLDDPEDIFVEDGHTGTCRFHDMRTEYLNACPDFFCRAAEREGLGYSSWAGDPRRTIVFNAEV